MRGAEKEIEAQPKKKKKNCSGKPDGQREEKRRSKLRKGKEKGNGNTVQEKGGKENGWRTAPCSCADRKLMLEYTPEAEHRKHSKSGVVSLLRKTSAAYAVVVRRGKTVCVRRIFFCIKQKRKEKFRGAV